MLLKFFKMKNIQTYNHYQSLKTNAYEKSKETGNLIPRADGVPGCTKLSNNLKSMPMKHTRVFTDPKTEV
jgi:hypothetical protein